ncbi:hypothetical protein [Parasitella parasitica]|uniref:Tyr recombinase domain-containing protein n=1 Tax=Parasitella parasitica TaxID=35722 RepID=A0A0B7N8U0_9FUNG|nr:hypothetical protein [Parasitella parasitica]
MSAFMRPSDLTRIPFAPCCISASGNLLLQVVASKETRKKRRIIKPFAIHPHRSYLARCPVECFRMLSIHSAVLTRPSNSNLFVKLNNTHKPLTSSTLSSWLHREFISLCTSQPGVPIRSLVSFRALGLGVSQADIVTLSNWTSSITFRNHYLRDHMATMDFTYTILSDDTTGEVFVDASDSLSLD